MKTTKLYNVIFPIWLLLFFPPVILISLVGNYLIDFLVLVICYYLFKLNLVQDSLKSFYKESIIKVWLFGFLADLIGAVILFITGITGDMLRLPYEITSAICYDPYSHPVAVLIIILATLVAGFFIFFFNYNITFRKLIKDNALRLKVSLTLAIITMPWTFFLPTKWFYHGF